MGWDPQVGHEPILGRDIIRNSQFRVKVIIDMMRDFVLEVQATVCSCVHS